MKEYKQYPSKFTTYPLPSSKGRYITQSKSKCCSVGNNFLTIIFFNFKTKSTNISKFTHNSSAIVRCSSSLSSLFSLGKGINLFLFFLSPRKCVIIQNLQIEFTWGERSTLAYLQAPTAAWAEMPFLLGINDILKRKESNYLRTFAHDVIK